MTRCSSFTLACCLLLAGTAHAGPVELFSGVSAEPNTVVLQYAYGGGGFFISSDGGAHFRLLCSAAIDPVARGVRDDGKLYLAEDAIYLGVFDGVWRGDKNGCGWQKMPEMNKQWIGAITGDPVDPKLTYLITTTGIDAMTNMKAKNGIYTHDGSGAPWTALGTQAELFLNTLHVVKSGAGKRFYETAVRNVNTTDSAGNSVEDTHYLVRVSDDNAKTWAEYEFGAADQFGVPDSYAVMQIVAVDPTNPDQIVASVVRSMELDDLVYSASQGKPGSWVKLAQVKDLKAVAFTPDGKLFYGDNDQDTPGLFELDTLDGMPKRLSDGWKVGCLRYDTDHSRMYACQNWQFGTADLSSGAFTALLDMRTADKFVDCPGATPMADLCQQQLLMAYCGPAHYEYAPVCSVYDRPWLEPLGGSGGANSSGAGGNGGAAGTATSATGGTGAAVGGSGSAGRVSVAGASGQAATAGSAGSSSDAKSGCSCSAPGARGTFSDGLTACLGALAVLCGWRRRRRAGR
jgi:hypothetical protein